VRDRDGKRYIIVQVWDLLVEHTVIVE